MERILRVKNTRFPPIWPDEFLSLYRFDALRKIREQKKFLRVPNVGSPKPMGDNSKPPSAGGQALAAVRHVKRRSARRCAVLAVW